MATEQTPGDRYLAEALALDPSTQGASIISLRREHLDSKRGNRTARRARTAKAPVAGTGRPVGPSREDVEALLRGIHDDFWTADIEEVGERLIALELDEFPDLTRYRNRLVGVNESRFELEEFEANPKAAKQFKDVLRDILIAPDKRAAELRKRYVSLSSNTNIRKLSKRSIAALSKYPDLYALESSWCKRILNSRQDRKDSQAIGKKAGIGFLLAWFMVKAVLKLLRDFSE